MSRNRRERNAKFSPGHQMLFSRHQRILINGSWDGRMLCSHQPGISTRRVSAAVSFLTTTHEDSKADWCVIFFEQNAETRSHAKSCIDFVPFRCSGQKRQRTACRMPTTHGKDGGCRFRFDSSILPALVLMRRWTRGGQQEAGP